MTRTARRGVPLPTRFTPQLATLVATVSDSDEWLHEIKFDGYRIGARVHDGAVRLLSRAGHDWTASFPDVRDAVAALPVRGALLDGEVAAVLGDGRTSFQALQKWLAGQATATLVYYVFDLLHLDGEDVGRRPLEERKARLEALLRATPRDGLVRYSSHVVGGGRAFFAAACARGLEGIVSKRRDRPYEAGRRGGWTKSKCRQRQPLVIGGFTEPGDGARTGLGALLLGVHDDAGTLRFAGKVGTGFTARSAADLRARLERLARRASPFTVPPPEARRWRARWVEPTLVADVRFTEWTDDGRLRQASFLGLCEDVDPRTVVRDDAVPTAEAAETSPPRRSRGSKESPSRPPDRGGETASPRPSSIPAGDRRGARAGARPPKRTATAARPPIARSSERPTTRAGATAARPPTTTGTATAARPPKGPIVVAGVRLTTPERVLYPEVPLTKRDLAAYYEDVADWILPHVAGRPLSLVRCPTGLGSCFYVKHATTADPAVLRKIDIREKDETREYAVVDAVPGLMALVQMSILEIHTWNSRADDLERPDRIIIDLDPGPEVAWPAVLEGAELVRVAFETLGLRSFVKTTGGKGLHVVVPLVPERDWDTCLDFARGVSEFIVRQHPQAYTTAMPKRGREKKILLDYYRNHRGSTAIAAYSTRARAGAPVAVPLAWDELRPALRSDRFTVTNVRARLRRLKRDPWREYWTLRQRITAKALAAVTNR